MTTRRPLLAGCGILQKEVRYLSRKNGWDLDFVFLDSVLHCDLCKLADCLTGCLKKNHDRDVVVFYGTCHPLMDQILNNADTFRTEGQNCVEILLGQELFNKELRDGTFFLLEEWAHRWDYITNQTLGHCRPEIRREIFQSDRNNFLAVRTPCSDDFSADAEAVAAKMGVPLRWMDVTLDHLEQVLRQSLGELTRRREGGPPHSQESVIDRKRSELK